jgi:hypothetical protein
MTDDLVTELRWRASARNCMGYDEMADYMEKAADRIEAQAKLIEALRDGVMSIWLKHDEPTTVEFLARDLLASIKEPGA